MHKEKLENARSFCKEVRKLGEKYNLSFFFVTEGASVTKNDGCEAIENVRNAHKIWEKKHGFDPEHDWSK